MSSGSHEGPQICEEVRAGRFPWKLRVKAVRAVVDIRAAK